MFRDVNNVNCPAKHGYLSFSIVDSVFSKMSRKDKYETSNRRQQTFMSAEDVAAGRKSSWQGVEITGNLKLEL